MYARWDIWAANDAFDPLVGRQEEIDRLILAFSRKMKSSALVVGERGVGKTTLAQGIARLIAQDLMPDRLKGMKFCALNFSALKSGCLFYGDLAKRFRDFIDSVTRDSSAIVFLDDMHKILNGSSADEFTDLARNDARAPQNSCAWRLYAPRFAHSGKKYLFPDIVFPKN